MPPPLARFYQGALGIPPSGSTASKRKHCEGASMQLVKRTDGHATRLPTAFEQEKCNVNNALSVRCSEVSLGEEHTIEEPRDPSKRSTIIKPPNG